MKEFVIAFLICLVATCWCSNQSTMPATIPAGIMGVGEKDSGTDAPVPIPEMNIGDMPAKVSTVKNVVGQPGTYFAEERGLTSY